MSEKPYAESCEQNRAPIFTVLEPLLREASSLLEIGSGTGQHGVYFAADLPHLVWQTSDRQENLAGIRQWLEEANLHNLRLPLTLDVVTDDWPDQSFDAVFSANTTHIMDETAAAAMMRGVGAVLSPGGCFALYGPFNYNGGYTSDSNRRFDQWLKERDANSGIKDFEWLDGLAGEAGLVLEADHEMPANNRTLVWRKPVTDSL